MADGPSTPPVVLPPGLLEAIAEGVGKVLAEQQAQPAGQADLPKPPLTPTQTGQALGAVLAPVAAPVAAKVAHKFKCPTLWVAIGTIAALLVQNPLGLQLHPATQMAAAAVAAVYVAATAIVDSAKQGGSNG